MHVSSKQVMQGHQTVPNILMAFYVKSGSKLGVTEYTGLPQKDTSN